MFRCTFDTDTKINELKRRSKEIIQSEAKIGEEWKNKKKQLRTQKNSTRLVRV